MDKAIRVGVRDWAQFAPGEDFYPPDMPPEWKLAYYANEFESACITLNAELVADTEWLEDLPDGFKPSFELTFSEQLDELVEILSLAEIQVDKLLIDDSKGGNSVPVDSIEARLTRSGINPPQQIVASSSLWTAETPQSTSGIALLPGSADLKQYRQWIELWASYSGQQQLTLWLDGGDASYSRLSELRTLVELMGY